MFRLSATLIVVALSLSATTVLAQIRGDVSPSHSLETPFITDWWIEGVPHWEIGGDSVITSDFVRLTPNQPSRYGYAWNSIPNEHKHWEATVTFNVRSKSSPGADGMGIWYVERPYKGRQGTILGNTPNFHGIGFLLDSYDNDNNRDNPAVAVISSIGRQPGDTAWDPDSDFSRTSIIRCQYDYRRNTLGAANEMIILYHERRLTVKLRNNQNARSDTFCGEVNDLDLPSNYYFGFTAVTGGVSDNHDIISFVLRPMGESAIHARASGNSGGAGGSSFDHSNDQREKSFWAAKENSNNENHHHHD